MRPEPWALNPVSQLQVNVVESLTVVGNTPPCRGLSKSLCFPVTVSRTLMFHPASVKPPSQTHHVPVSGHPSATRMTIWIPDGLFWNPPVALMSSTGVHINGRVTGGLAKSVHVAMNSKRPFRRHTTPFSRFGTQSLPPPPIYWLIQGKVTLNFPSRS